MIPLKQLEPRWLRYSKEPTGIYLYYVKRPEAHGIFFLCPKCYQANNGPVGTHGVICWSRSAGTPETAEPLPGRWKMDGDSFDNLTLNADPPGTARSVQITAGCNWHGFITNGQAHD